MKFLMGFLVAIVTSLGLTTGAAIAADGNKALITTSSTATDHIVVISDVRHIETKSKKKKKKNKKKSRKKKRKSIAQIRDKAIKNSLGGLKALRPYTTNYSRLKSSVRRYWKRNVKHPTTNGLARTIMRYVKRKDRKLVRSSVYSGAKSGVRKVKKQLKKRNS